MKKVFSVICAIALLAMGLCCTALAEDELNGAWNNDEEEVSLIFNGEGIVILSDESSLAAIPYEWDGSTLSIADEQGEALLTAYMDEYGDLIFEDAEGYFYRDELPDYSPAREWDGLNLPGTEWELEGVVVDFCWDGSILMDGEYAGAYYWDGQPSAQLHIDEGSISLSMDEDGIYFEDEDGETYAFTYLGGTTLLSGAYDNDTEEVSIFFYLDGTFTLSDVDEAVEGGYILDGNGNLYLESEYGSANGYYDSSDDTFLLYNMLNAYFYSVSEPGYAPEPDMRGDPEEVLASDGIAGTAWDFTDSESSMIFNADGTGAQTSPWDSIAFEYTWDGETLVISTEWMTINGELDADGNLVIGDDILVRVDTASYAPGVYSGGMEGELEGEWISEDGNIRIYFDGETDVDYQVIDSEGSSVGAGTYSYDGAALTVSLIGDEGVVEDYEGALSSDGNIVIALWGEEVTLARVSDAN